MPLAAVPTHGVQGLARPATEANQTEQYEEPTGLMRRGLGTASAPLVFVVIRTVWCDESGVARSGIVIIVGIRVCD